MMSSFNFLHQIQLPKIEEYQLKMKFLKFFHCASPQYFGSVKPLSANANQSSETIQTNENNNCIEYLFQEWDGSDWVNLLKITYTYIPTTGIKLDRSKNLTYHLSNNYPNPFNPSTKINYSITKQSYVTLKVFDVLGREIETLINKEQPQGNYEVEFDAPTLTSGIYFYRIQAGNFVDTKKMILLR